MLHPRSIGGLALGLLLAAVAVAAAPAPAAAIELNKLTCAFTFWPGQGVYHLAKELGYFAEEGIEVELVLEDDIQVQTAAMEAGDLNCNSRTIGEYQSRPRQKGTKGIVVAAMDLSLGGDGVVASGDIKSVCDLKGKTFAMEPTIPANLLLQMKLKDECGLKLSDLNVMQIATADGMAVFADPSVSAVSTYDPLMSQIVAAGERPGAYRLVDSADYPGLIIDVWFIHDELIEKNPELVRGMLRGVYRAIDFYFKDPDKAHAIMAPHFNLTAAEMAEAYKGLKLTTYEEALEWFGTADKPGPLKQNFETVMQLNIEQDVAGEALSYEEQVTAKLLAGLFDGHKR